MIQKYQPSGRFTAGTFLAAVPALAVLAGIGVAYQFIVEWCPFIYINALLSFGAALAAALGAGLTLQYGKCRNVAVGAVLGLLLGSAALAGSHYWAYTSFSKQFAVALSENVEEADSAEPSAEAPAVAEVALSFPSYVQLKAQLGWSVGRSGDGLPIQGTFFYIIWAIEAGILLVISTLGGVNAAKAPYCERCDAWADESQVNRVSSLANTEPVEQLQRAENVDQMLEKLPEGESEDGVRRELHYSVDRCPACKQVGWLSVKLYETSTNKKGEEETKESEVWEHIELSADQMQQLDRERQEWLSSLASAEGRDEGQPEAAEQTAAENPPVA